MSTYKFDWKDTIHGHTEIEADNSFEAEKQFREMTLEQRLEASELGADKHTLDIKFIDIGFGDIQTPEEWEDTFKHCS
jgi:hypothetical protein